MIQFSNKLIIKDPFEMPAVDDTTVLVLRECADLVPHCWIWNESVGYLEVVTYSGYDIYVTVKNTGMKENATSGTIFPSCMEFLITAPNATPIIDNTVTCLRADFKCPTVGQEALMSVDSTSAIRVGDIIIVDTRYQYLVTEIINEHTMKVLNEEKGKESGVIDVKCNECVPVKIFESTHCCEALQEQVDDIYDRIDTKKSVVSNNVLLSVAHGLDAISDVSYDIELDIDTDLSKYDNSVSKFTSLRYFKENLNAGVVSFSPDKSAGLTAYNLGTVANYYDNIYVNEIHGGTGRSSYIKFFTDGSDTEYHNGTSSAYNAHSFFSGGKKLVAFAHDEAYFHTSITPNPIGSSLNLGLTGKEWANVYTDAITLNGTTYTSIPTVNDATLTIYNSDGVTPFVSFSANAATAVTATLPSSGGSYTATAPISIDANNDISISQASSTTDGYLSSTDWNTFNNKSNGLVYFEESLSGTTATFQSKSGSASTFNLGSSSRWFSDSYVETSRVNTIVGQNNIDRIAYSASSAIDHEIIYDAGNNLTTYGTHLFRSGNGNKFAIRGNDLISYVDSNPDGDAIWSLGSSTNRWNRLYVKELLADNNTLNCVEVNFDFSNITGGVEIQNGNLITTPDLTIANTSFTHSLVLLVVIYCNISRLRQVADSGTINHAGPRFRLKFDDTTAGTTTTLQDYYVEELTTTTYTDKSYTLFGSMKYTIPIGSILLAHASVQITSTGLSNGKLTLPGGTNQFGKLIIFYGHAH